MNEAVKWLEKQLEDLGVNDSSTEPQVFAEPYEEECAEMLPKVLAEIRRLRALVKKAEAADAGPGEFDHCPWCGTDLGMDRSKRKHAPDCEAFTVDGEVR